MRTVIAVLACLSLMFLLSVAPSRGLDEPARQAALDLARAALAKTLAVGPDEVELVDATPVEWPDAALGCPEKGAVYAQMIVPGYRIHLRVEGVTHDVHVGASRAVVCGETGPTPAERAIATVAHLRDLARRDLAERLKLPAKDVQVTLVRPATWPNAALGCPEPGRTYEPSPTAGFLIELRARRKLYHYHSDQTRVVACDAPTGL